MKIAFYAPMKPPDHPTPSGDRLIAHLLLKALESAGHTPLLESRFRSYEGQGDAGRQRRLKAVGERLARRLIARLRRRRRIEQPRCWVTYHLYHKAPDWIGLPVARALEIPYVVVEASVAPKQASGPWREGYVAATAAIAHADLVVSLNRNDMPCLEPVVADRGRLVHLPPFLDLAGADGSCGGEIPRAGFASALKIPADVPWLTAVAMMRSGNKLDSYRVLARALARTRAAPWHLLLVGDGPVRPQVEDAFRCLGPSRVTFLGARRRDEIPALLGACDLFVWPAVAEPLGMAMLEAQAAGLAVVAGNSGGVSGIVRHGQSGLLTPPGDVAAFADAVDRLLKDAGARRAMGMRARARATAAHGLDTAAADLHRWLTKLVPDAPT